MTRLYKHEKVRMDIEERRDVTRFLALSTVVPQGIAEPAGSGCGDSGVEKRKAPTP